MKRLFLVISLFLAVSIQAQAEFLADIQDSVQTEFGTYRPYTVEVTPAVPTYSVEQDLSNIGNLCDFILTANQTSLLYNNHFVFIPQRSGLYATPEETGAGYLEMYDIYLEAFDRDIPQFVTSDVILHTFHKLFDRSLLQIEQSNLYYHLGHMSSGYSDYFCSLFPDESDSLRHIIYGFLSSYFGVGGNLAGYDISLGYMSTKASNELSLINAASSYETSPLFNAYPEDYTQYAPRGHYTLSETLEKYFQTMMWYGRQTFVLKDVGNQPRTDLTGAALYLAYMKQNNLPSETAWSRWERIERRSSFFVGKSDDLTIDDYIDYALEYFGADIGTLDPADFLVESVLLDFIDSAIVHLPEPQITSETPKGLRLLGQKFTPDTNVFDELVLPNVPDRTLPTALDVMAALHSDEAYSILTEQGVTSLQGYSSHMESLQTEFQNYPAEQWAENLYWNWLYCLMPLLTEKGEGFPLFMQNQPWARKELNTALGSWSELRHDTILYMKQAFTVGIGEGAESLQGYVEPNPWLYARLAALVDYMLVEFYWLDENELDLRLNDFRDMLLILKSISEKELAGGTYTEEELELLPTFGETIGRLVTFGSLGEVQANYSDGYWDQPWSDDDMSVIADVHTDLTQGNCLEVGVGHPFRIAVICPVGDELKLCVGAAFSFYEFAQPMSSRLTDETWIDLLTSANPPSVPDWTECFYDPNSSFSCNYVTHEMTDGYLAGIDEGALQPVTYKLKSIYPNPFNSKATLTVELPAESMLQIVVYNVLGQKVTSLVDGRFAQGVHRFSLDATHLAAGVYFVHAIVEGELNQVKQVVLLR